MYEAILVGVGTLVTAALAALGTFLTLVWKNRQRESANAVRDYKAIFDRQEKRITRLEAQTEEGLETVRRMAEAHAMCEVHLADLYGHAVRQHETARRHAAALAKLGQDPGPVPDLPPPPPRTGDVGFLARTAQHNAAMAGAAARVGRPGGPTT